MTSRTSELSGSPGWLGSLLLLFVTLAVHAAEPPLKSFRIPAGDAFVTLQRFSEQSGEQIVYPVDQVRGVQTSAVQGEFSSLEALQRMLARTNLSAVQEASGAITIVRNSPSPRQSAPGRKPAVDVGVIEGRVFNTASGEFVERARVTVEGSSHETFTDSAGEYRLANVPAGNARVTVFYTGLGLHSESVSVPGGRAVRQDFNLAPAAAKGVTKDGVVQLSEYVVGARREMDAAAIAINEQRFADNMKNVVTVEEFGTVAEGNVAEVLKFMPGVTIDYGAGDASTVSIGGVPAAYVPVTVGGFALATAASSGTRRVVQFEQFSINNIARIEVLHSPTPESSGAALAGSINMVTRSAFERSDPVFNYSAYVMMRDDEKSLKKTPGPFGEPTYKIHPGFDFSYIRPVNERFGFTLSAGHNAQYSLQPLIRQIWAGGGAATNGNALPDTTPGNPYLTQVTVRDGGKMVTRSNVGSTIDYKLGAHDRISFSFLFAEFENEFRNKNFNFNVGRVLPGQFSTSHTDGAPGQGQISLSQGANRKHTTTYMPTLTYRHDGLVWSADVGLGYSRAANKYTDIPEGFVNGVAMRRRGVTVAFDEIFDHRPGEITVRDTTGAMIDPNRIDNYALISMSSTNNSSTDVQRTAFGNIGRDFTVRSLPVAVKVGVDLRQQTRDIRNAGTTWSHVGADGRPSTTPVTGDDRATVVLDEHISQRFAPYGFGQVQWAGHEIAYDYLQANPAYFTTNPNNEYRSRVGGSKFAEETVSAAYFRGDIAFFERRLKLVGGVRAEQTNIKALGPLTDPTGNYQRDASGRVLLGANGRPLLIVPRSDALGVSQRTFIERGQRTRKEYLRWFPSLNASYTLRDNLVARGAYYQSIGRPDFNQYAGGLTLPDTEVPPGGNARITVNNAGIKAWMARTFKLRLEYYFEPIGQFTVSAFRRDYENFFATSIAPSTPEFLALYGLDPDLYGEYDVSTQRNLGSTVRTTGADFDYKQVLSFLPHWARGVQVFANASTARVTGDDAASFLGYSPRSASWGVSLTREKYNLRLNWNYRSRSRRNEVRGRSIEPGTFQWRTSRLLMDIQGDFNLSRRFALFFNMRNIGDVPETTERAGPSTPKVARFNQRAAYGALWTFGIKGTF